MHAEMLPLRELASKHGDVSYLTPLGTPACTGQIQVFITDQPQSIHHGDWSKTMAVNTGKTGVNAKKGAEVHDLAIQQFLTALTRTGRFTAPIRSSPATSNSSVVSWSERTSS